LGFFGRDFRNTRSPQKRSVQFRSSKAEQGEKEKAAGSDRPSLSAFADCGEQDEIVKEPFADMA